MQLNTVMYTLLSPAAVVGPDGVENWAPVGASTDPDELRQVAALKQLPRFAIMCGVCIAVGSAVPILIGPGALTGQEIRN